MYQQSTCASGENTILCRRRIKSSTLSACLTSGHHNNPLNPELTSANVDSVLVEIAVEHERIRSSERSAGADQAIDLLAALTEHAGNCDTPRRETVSKAVNTLPQLAAKISAIAAHLGYRRLQNMRPECSKSEKPRHRQPTIR